MKTGSTGPPSPSRLISMHANSGSSCPIGCAFSGAPAARSSVRLGTTIALPSHESLYALPRPTGTRSHSRSGFWLLVVASSFLAASTSA
eukprot:2979796-Prymnesium_polylepis.1